MFEPREYEIFLLFETNQHYFFIYFRDIQRQRKKVNILNVLRFVIWKVIYEYVCIVISIFSKYIYFYICLR